MITHDVFSVLVWRLKIVENYDITKSKIIPRLAKIQLRTIVKKVRI
jgi:hypothetical protein